MSNDNNIGVYQTGNFDAIDQLGKRLSLELGCPVKFPGNQKNAFACHHGMPILVFRLKGNVDWSWLKGEHEKWLSQMR